MNAAAKFIKFDEYRILGKPLPAFDPVPYVKTWLRGHRNANDTRVTDTVPTKHSVNEQELWKLH